MPTSLDWLRDYLLSNIGKPVSIDRIKAAIGSTWTTELNHLSVVEGLPILVSNTRLQGVTSVVLVSRVPQPKFEPNVAASLRRPQSAWRDLCCCQCGAAHGETDEYEPRRSVRMTIGYILDLTEGGSDDPSNLKAICSVCNEGAANITPDRPSAIKLLSQLRRAKASDQLEVLHWLIKKFPQQSKSALDG